MRSTIVEIVLLMPSKQQLRNAVVLCFAWLSVLGCSERSASSITKGTDEQDPVPAKDLPLSTARISTLVDEGTDWPPFKEISRQVGLTFKHNSPLSEQRHLHLVMGSGIGWLDFDRDGWPDLYACQGSPYEKAGLPNGLTNDALYRNQSGEFIDISERAGVRNLGYSMGIAAADYDNDGFIDLCVTGYGQNRLLHNNGDGTFSVAALPNELRPGRLSAGVAWADVDADGNLDLYVANYADLKDETYPLCEQTEAGKTISIVCHPNQLTPMSDELYLNSGAGEFELISLSSGIAAGTPQPGLGVVSADLDQDGDADFYVANDAQPNQLWENLGKGKFADRAAESGTATNRHGAREAGMGIALGDADGNGTFDLLVTNFYGETNTLYRNDGSLLLADCTDEFGLAATSRSRLGFGTSFIDLDNDGWLDLLVANGHIHDRLHEIERNEPFAQLPLLLYNEQGRRFRDVTSTAGSYFQNSHVARSTAVADFDRDGDTDVVVSSLDGSLALLQNAITERLHWIRVELTGIESNRGGVGATIILELDGRKIVCGMRAGTGYLSNDEASMLIGVGSATTVSRVTVRWPSNLEESWDSLAVNRDWRLVEGTGKGMERDR